MRFVERNTRTAWRIEGLRREDVPEYPMKALREAITNAVMHRDWFMDGANVLVEIYTDRIEVSSPGGLPKGMTLSDLGRKSIRRNSLIADLLHRITFIEKAGTGIKRIRDEAREQGCPDPVFQETGFFTATFYPNPEVRILAATMRAPSSRDQDAGQVAPEVTPEVRLLIALTGEMTRQVLQSAMALKDDEHFRKAYLLPAIEAGFIEMTIPDKPRSPKQRYRITPLGMEVLKKAKKEK
jgi:ATP-dependent DNA helicase RecG